MFEHSPVSPAPDQIVLMLDGPARDAPVLLKTSNCELTICTYCVGPTAPVVSGGMQPHPESFAVCPSKLAMGFPAGKSAAAFSLIP